MINGFRCVVRDDVIVGLRPRRDVSQREATQRGAEPQHFSPDRLFVASR